MGEAKLKLSAKQRILKANPRCIYCGDSATTVDHCPPRCFFVGRLAPEGYEFSCCKACNDIARRDEQALGVLFRIKLSDDSGVQDQHEWQALVKGVRNNQPELIREWHVSRNDIKHAMREAFGIQGDKRRREGWGALNIGPLSKGAIERFIIKLGQALYYRHTNEILNGFVYNRHISVLERDFEHDALGVVLEKAPLLPALKRNNRPLHDQFLYRFNADTEAGVMYAVVQFSEQYIFQIIALRKDADYALRALGAEQGHAADSFKDGHKCFTDD